MSERAFAKLDFFVVQDIFFSNTCRFADVVLPGAPEPGKGRHLHQHGAAHPAALPGVRTARGMPARLADHRRTSPTSLGADWNYQHPSEIMDEIASLTPMFAGVNYERLEGYKSLQWPVAADGTDQPLLYTKHFAFPDGKARLFPVSLDRPHRSAGRRIRPAPEQWAAAGALPRRQPDLSHRGNSREDCRTPSSKSRRNWPKNAASKAEPGCSWSRVTGRFACARW